MKRVLTILVLTFFLADAHAQINAESLFRDMHSDKEDSNKVKTLLGLGEYYSSIKPDSALFYIEQGMTLARKLKFEQGEADALFSMAKVFEFIGNYSKALELFLQSLKLSEQLNNTISVAANLLFIGEVFGYQKDYKQSLSYYFKAQKIAETINYYIISARALLNIANIYEKLNQPDSALLYTRQSFFLTNKYNIPFLKGRTLNTFGNIYSKKGNTGLAMDYYRKSMPILREWGDDNYVCLSALGMARLFHKEGHTDSCLYYARQSLKIASDAGFALQMLDASSFLTEFFKNMHVTDSAFAYQQITIAAKDSLYSQEKTSEFANISYSEQLRQQEIKEAGVQYRNQVKIYILLGGLCGVIFLAFILYRNNRQKQRANNLLERQKKEIDLQKAKVEEAFRELKATQVQLVQSEKMASLGELTAGIAHEIQNPLNFVNNFSEVNAELIDEMKKELETGNTGEALIVADDIKENNLKITHHGKRADAIVKGMLQHSRGSSGQRELANINAIADECLRLSYHGLRAKDKSFNAILKTDFDETIGKSLFIQQDIVRVLVNLFNNAFYSVAEKKKRQSAGLSTEALAKEGYQPTVIVITKKTHDKVELHIRDNGMGIPQKVLDKIFQPFFTTKPTGQGTGLGLSLSYDIIKAHGGEIKVEAKEGEYAEFIIDLPLK